MVLSTFMVLYQPKGEMQVLFLKPLYLVIISGREEYVRHVWYKRGSFEAHAEYLTGCNVNVGQITSVVHSYSGR